MINIGALTDLAFATIATTNLKVGDGVAPVDGGWLSGSANVDAFIPYTVISSVGAALALPDLWSEPDWSATFSLRSYGGSRKQCDFAANVARNAVKTLRDESFGPVNWFKIINVADWRIGSVERLDQVDPPYWQVFDSFSLICSRTSAPQ